MISNRPKYKKPKSPKKQIIATIKVLSTFGSISLISIILYFGFKDGWKAVLDWFVSKWACMFAVILIVGLTAIWWVYSFIRNLKKVTEND